MPGEEIVVAAGPGTGKEKEKVRGGELIEEEVKEFPS